ncbi:MAG TPA: hypothetical protein VKR83_13055 [Ktedonobacteraceae bacterium]|nr:hypothetical protein [Ktedonobacteraceae bacterium]
MPEPKQPKQDKKLSLHPLEFEEALKGLLATEPPPKEKKDKPVPKRRSRSTGKKKVE